MAELDKNICQPFICNTSCNGIYETAGPNIEIAILLNNSFYRALSFQRERHRSFEYALQKEICKYAKQTTLAKHIAIHRGVKIK